MYSLLILFFLTMINNLAIVKIHRDSLYIPQSQCAFISNITLPSDASIQSCVWECVHEPNCQTAVYYGNEKICSTFTELNSVGQLQPAGNTQASVICYQKNHSEIILFQNFNRFVCFQILLPLVPLPQRQSQHHHQQQQQAHYVHFQVKLR